MTPNDIEILIHCHCCPEPHPRLHAPAVKEAIRSLLANKLIEPAKYGPDTYNTTARGAAHIEQLCQTAWPTQIWVNERGEPIYNDPTNGAHTA